MTRVLVCGGRDFHDEFALRQVMDSLHQEYKFSIVIEGGAKGADELAGKWAEDKIGAVVVYPADWEKYGKAAGAIRNQQMINEGFPDLVVAFPGGRGTQHMISVAQKASIPVLKTWEIIWNIEK